MSAAELLLNPNLAYLLLVVGGLLVILALFTPGTGILEIGALFILILAGWQVFNLSINLWALVLLIVGVVPFIIAMRRSRQVAYLVVAIVAFVVGSSFMFRGEHWWLPAVNPILAGTVSVMTAVLIWFVVTRIMEADQMTPAHDLGALVGSVGESRTEIHEDGSAQIAGELWTVRSLKPISPGKKVRVVKKEGLILLVEEANMRK